MKRSSLIIFLGSLVLIASMDALAIVITGPFVPGSGNWITVPNGGFESGLTGWSDVNCNNHLGTFSTAHSGPVAQSASSAQSSPIPPNGSGPGFCRRLEPILSLDLNTTYVLSGFFNTQELDAPKIYAGLVNNALTYTAAIVGSVELALGEDQWQFAWMEFQPTQSALYLRIVHDENFDNGKHGYFDEIAVTELSEFSPPTQAPEPATIALMGLGLAGIGYRRLKAA